MTRRKPFPLCKVKVTTPKTFRLLLANILQTFIAVKLLEDLATLTKSYKSTCKRLGTPAYSPFLQELSACTEAVQPLTKVNVFQRPHQPLGPNFLACRLKQAVLAHTGCVPRSCCGSCRGFSFSASAAQLCSMSRACIHGVQLCR